MTSKRPDLFVSSGCVARQWEIKHLIQLLWEQTYFTVGRSLVSDESSAQ